MPNFSFHQNFSHLLLLNSFIPVIFQSSNMTEPNVVKSRAQKIREGTMSSYFGSLPQGYSK